MLNVPMDIVQFFPVRKSKKQKQAFRNAVQSYAEGLDYTVTTEKGSFGCRNLVIGDPTNAKFLVTAHYDTCARLPFPNLITPCNFGLFILYQLVITFLLLTVPILIAVVLVLLTGVAELGILVWYFCFFGEMLLMYIGPANPSNANDNTSGVVTVLEIARELPHQLRGDVCFVLFDLEEAGLIGSSAYRSAHKKEVKGQLVLNLDCVGDGDEILFFPSGKVCRNKEKMGMLRTVEGSMEGKRITVRGKGFSYYPSDQVNFPWGVGVAAMHRCWAGLYLGRIHTPRDTVLDKTNVNILRDCLIKLISSAV